MKREEKTKQKNIKGVTKEQNEREQSKGVKREGFQALLAYRFWLKINTF